MTGNREQGKRPWAVGVRRFVISGMARAKREAVEKFRGPNAAMYRERYLDIRREGLEMRALTEAPLTREEMRAMPKFSSAHAEMYQKQWLRLHREGKVRRREATK